MNKDQGIGAALLVASILGIIIYACLLYTCAILVLQITAFIAVAAVLSIAACLETTSSETSLVPKRRAFEL